MHSQGNYTKHLPPPPPPPFHKNPAASSFPLPPPPFHHGPVPPQTQGIQQGHGNSHLPPVGDFAYPHAPSSGAPPQHGSPALSGTISGNSYFTGPQPPQVHGNNQILHSYPTSGAQCSPWSQSVSQFPQTALCPAPGTHPLPASQGYTTEKGPTHQNPSQIPQPPRLPPYASSLTRDDPYSSSMPAHPQPHFPPLGPLPPPPPLPTHSPPGAPPLPPSDKLPKNDGGHSSMGHSAYRDNLMLDSPSPTTYTGATSLLDRNEKAVKAAEAVATHSPDDSDMDMEDDITQPDEVKQKSLSTNLNDACISMSKELDKKDQLRESPHFEGNKVPNRSEDGDLISAGSSASKDQRLGAEIRSGFDTSVDGKLCSEAHKFTVYGETDNLMDAVIAKSPPRKEKFSELTVAVAAAETVSNKLSSELKESADAFKLLEGYATDSSTDNGEHHLGDVTPPSSKVESTNRDVKAGRSFWSESTLESASEPDKLDLSQSMIKSPRNGMGADTSSSAVKELADNSHRNQESVPTERGKSNLARSDVDEFGRLVKEGATDSDTSDSPRHTRKRVRRDRWRSRSRSNSVSPRDRRRRSPRGRRERRGRSRSFSPRRRRSRTRSPVLRRRSRSRTPVLRRRSRTRSPVLRRRSRTRSPVSRRRSRTRSPVLRRGSDMVGDKNRRDKGQFAECFNFLKGKCYRGATCRFSHNEPHKTDMVRYNSGKHQHEDTNPDFHEEKKPKSADHENISIQDEGTEPPKDMPILKEIKVPENFPADSTVHSHDKLASGETASLYTENVTPRNLSGYFFHYMPMGNESSYVQNYHYAGDPMQGMTHSHPVAQSQSNTSYSSMGVNVSSNTNASQSMPYFQPASSMGVSVSSNVNASQSMPYFQPASSMGVSVSSNANASQSMPYFQPASSMEVNVSSKTNASQSMHYFQPASSMGVNVSSNTNASHSMPYFQPASYGLQYNTVSGASILGEPPKLSSSIPRVSGDFLETGLQSHQHDVMGSRISNHFNPYASTFDQPISTKFSSTSSVQGNDKQFTPMYGTSVGLSSVSVDANKIGIVTSRHLTHSSSSAIAAEALTTRPGGDQYDPLYDSIEQPSNSLTGAGLQNNEIIGDSDNFQRSSGSSKVLNRENVKQGVGGVSADISLDFEEYGETADNIEVGDVLNGSPSTPNNPMEIHAGEIEIDQVKISAKKKGKDTRSSNLFKSSIASFVKEVLKPSWRQGNMSKEAFKTIVKKTVDKVSGAMKSHKIPRSQAKIDHYINSSRGKLTKLVMGYVDKFVKM